MIKIKSLFSAILALWLLSAILTYAFTDLATAASFGDSFGAINSLFSGVALALAIYSMILQQRQNSQFESKTLAAMTQQTQTIELIKVSLEQQANVARIAALTHLVQREEDRIETLKGWGMKKYSNESYYGAGIKKAEPKINEYQENIKRIGNC